MVYIVNTLKINNTQLMEIYTYFKNQTLWIEAYQKHVYSYYIFTLLFG